MSTRQMYHSLYFRLTGVFLLLLVVGFWGYTAWVDHTLYGVTWAPGEERWYDDLQDAVARLPWDLRLVLVMYYYDGRSVKSVAETLDISTSGVYVKLRTALRELHETLTAEGEKP